MGGVLGGEIGYRILKAVGKTDHDEIPAAYTGVSKLEKLLGVPFWQEIENKSVIDFGCVLPSRSHLHRIRTRSR